MKVKIVFCFLSIFLLSFKCSTPYHVCVKNSSTQNLVLKIQLENITKHNTIAHDQLLNPLHNICKHYSLSSYDSINGIEVISLDTLKKILEIKIPVNQSFEIDSDKYKSPHFTNINSLEILGKDSITLGNKSMMKKYFRKIQNKEFELEIK